MTPIYSQVWHCKYFSKPYAGTGGKSKPLGRFLCVEIEQLLSNAVLLKLYSSAQNASAAAARMTGGSAGWSAPPTVFKEKSLLEIEEERRQKQNKHKNKGPAPKIDQRSVLSYNEIQKSFRKFILFK